MKRMLYTANIYRRNRRRRIRRFLKAIALLLLVWGIGFVWFVGFLPKGAPISSMPRADGIVVLTGGVGRVEAGINLLKEGKGKRLLISGVNQNLNSETIMDAIAEKDELTDCCIDLGRLALDTRGNATETANWAQENDFHTLIIVTADYHLPRSSREFAALKSNLEFTWLAVPSDETLPNLALEYTKFLISYVRIYINDLGQD